MQKKTGMQLHEKDCSYMKKTKFKKNQGENKHAILTEVSFKKKS